MRALRIALWVCWGLTACGGSTRDRQESGETDPDFARPNAGDVNDDSHLKGLWDSLVATQYRNNWERPDGYETRRTSDAHGGEVDVYVNPTVAGAMHGQPGIALWPVESMVAMDLFNNGSLTKVLAMEKREDGWYWAEFSSGGAALRSGQPSYCVECHSTGDDYLQSVNFPTPVTE